MLCKTGMDSSMSLAWEAKPVDRCLVISEAEKTLLVGISVLAARRNCAGLRKAEVKTKRCVHCLAIFVKPRTKPYRIWKFKTKSVDSEPGVVRCSWSPWNFSEGLQPNELLIHGRVLG